MGVWVGGVPVATVCVVAILLIASSDVSRSDLDATIRFAATASFDAAPVQRMFDDLPMFGTGAGTFAEVYQLYGSFEDGAAAIASTPLSGVLAVELGKIAFWTG